MSSPERKMPDAGKDDDALGPTEADMAERTAFDDTSSLAEQLASKLEKALADDWVEALSQEALQRLVGALCRNYAARLQTGEDFPPLGPGPRPADTDVMLMASGLLRAANLQAFELGMWQSWTGR